MTIISVFYNAYTITNIYCILVIRHLDDGHTEGD